MAYGEVSDLGGVIPSFRCPRCPTGVAAVNATQPATVMQLRSDDGNTSRRAMEEAGLCPRRMR